MKKICIAILIILFFGKFSIADIYVLYSCSGGGKDTIAAEACKNVDRLVNVPRITTRDRRPNEKDGVDMTFVSVDKFRKMQIENKLFGVEFIGGTYYAADIDRIRKEIDKKNDVVLIGKFATISQIFPNVKIYHVLIYVSSSTQRKRLDSRNTETAKQKEDRLANYKKDMDYLQKYNPFVIDNNFDSPQTAAKSLESFIVKNRAGGKRSEKWKN